MKETKIAKENVIIKDMGEIIMGDNFTLSDAFKKEKERAVGYTEIWSVVQRLEVDVREFIQKLKISLRDKYSDKKCLYETAIITGKVFEEIDNLAGEELTNHSPQEILKEKSLGVLHKPEDKPLKKGCKDCMVLHSPQNCSKKEGCGKRYIDEFGIGRECREGQLCQACSGEERMNKNKTIINKVKEEQWNEDFKKAIKEKRITGKTMYWLEIVDKMLNNALNKLRQEFVKQEKKE